MFNNSKSGKQAKNSMFKRIQFLMTRNFFTIEEFSKLSSRKALKVIKLIAKAEGIKLQNQEAKEVSEFLTNLNSVKKNISSSVTKLFTFLKQYSEVSFEVIKTTLVRLIAFVFNFRIDFKQVLRV